MTFVFISNYFNHHQKPLADAMYALLGDGYRFIETEAMSAERVNMGWGMEKFPDYVLHSYADSEQMQRCKKLLLDADVVMYGSAPYEMLVPRLQAGKLTFKYSERIYKEGCPIYKLPWHFYLNTKRYRRYKNFYILCASAYASADFAKTFTFIDKAYKWGYFTQIKESEDLDDMLHAKEPASMLWVARFLALKHPEAALAVAKRLKADGYDFKLRLIGNGELETSISQQIRELGLTDCVEMLGAMKPEQVRDYMEQSEIFLFTSDRNEGWGAVLNESMNSACAVVASHAIGSVPFLVKDGENGLVYQSGDIDDLYSKVKYLLDHPEQRKKIALHAYETMTQEWNAENAAKKLLNLCEQIMSGNEKPFPYADGVCSKAEILKDNWKKH